MGKGFARDTGDTGPLQRSRTYPASAIGKMILLTDTPGDGR